MRRNLLLALTAFALVSCSFGPSSSKSATGLSSDSLDPSSSGSQPASSSAATSQSYIGPSSSASEPVFVDNDVKNLPVKQRTFYQLLVYSFADGDGDGIGDFKGIIDHLDYIAGLGVGGLWLSPILDAESYHAYDTIDYYKINPRYEVTVSGVKYDLQKLLDACHERGIKVLMDLVLNHSAPSCAWRTEHPDWYKTPNAFGDGMPDFNYGNTALRTEIKNVGKYWLNQGVDGFRLDAAKWIYNYGGMNDGADDEKNYSWWKEFYSACKSVKDDVYMVAEVLVDGNLRDDRNYYKTTMDSTFNFEMRDAMINAGKYASPNNYIQLLVSYQNEIRGYHDGAIEASCISNHDIGRFNAKQSLTPGQQAVSGMMNILAPGDSFVYYGEELGLDGTCTGARKDFYEDLNYRTPMPFKNGRTVSQSYLYSSVPGKDMTTTTISGKTADADQADSSSLYNVFAKTIQTKNRSKTLYAGKVEAMGNGNEYTIGSFVTTYGDQAETTIFNTGNSVCAVTIQDGQPVLVGEAAYQGYNFVEGNRVFMQPYSCVVLEGRRAIASVAKDQGSEPVTSSSSAIAIAPDDPGSEVKQAKSGTLTLHVKNTDNWSDMKCYAWITGGATLSAGWPGDAMQKDGDWFTITINSGASNLVFNNGSGKQTVDLYRNNAGEYWFIPNSGSGKLNGNWYTQNPLA